MDRRTIEMAALGRPFELGMLYDCREDKLVPEPGFTLCDHEELQQDITEKPQYNHVFKIVASESFPDKSSSVGVDDSLKVSFLSGLVKVDGSAKYLKDNKTSKHQARVTLQCITTTKFKELPMNQLRRDNIKHPHVIEQGLATHVVTAILYGAQAFFVFDREVSDTENIQNIEIDVQGIIKKIPSISNQGEGVLKMEDRDIERVKNFSCKFHGDFILPQSPVTFGDAVRVYQDLNKLLGPNGEKAVPVTVWLLPLTVLDSAAAKLVRQISLGLVMEVEKTLEHLADLEMRCRDLIKTTTVQQFPQIASKIKTFMAFCSHSKLRLQETLATKLPLIRGGGEEEAELAEILKKRGTSPFSSDCLNKWVTYKGKEANQIEKWINMMKNAEILSSQQELDDRILDTKNAVCFVFTSLENEEPYLTALDKYMRGDQSDQPKSRAKDIEKEQWFSDKNVREATKQRAKVFGDFAEANQDNEEVKFFIIGSKDESHEGSTIYLYEDGFEVTDDFDPPTQPEKINVDEVSHSSVSLSFCAPSSGVEAVTGYRLEFCASGGEWRQQNEANTGTVTVTGLTPGTEYSFRVRAVTDVGLGPAGKVKAIQTSPDPEVKSMRTPPDSNVKAIKPDSKVKSTETSTDSKVKSTETSTDSKVKSTETSPDPKIKIIKPPHIHNPEPKGPMRLSEELKKICKVIETKGSLQILKVPLRKDRLDVKGCARFIYGKDSIKTNCTIMVMGATGAGKSTLINGMINYILGVQWTDPYRFKLVNEEAKSQAESQTSEVTVYKINHDNRFMIDYSLTIIDTPGFGDTRGIQRDREITEQIRNLFSNDFGVSDIHAVCFVAQSSSARLSPTQRYVFDSVLSIFGKDVAENIRILVTFGDGQIPPVLESIKKAEVPCPKDKDGQPSHYKFNNSALFTDNQTSAMSFDQMFWNMGKESMRSFFDALHKTEPKSLTLTKEVLQERKQLEQSVNDIKRKVKEGLAKMDEIQQTKELLKKNKAEIERNKDFEYTVKVMKPTKEDISGTGKYITNCQDCHETCHYPCKLSDDADKKRCAAMDPNGNCTKCKGKCHWSKHYNQKYRWEYKEVTEKRTTEELKKNYLKGTKEKLTTEALISKLNQEYLRLKDNVKVMVNEAVRLINRLKEIALKPNPLSAPDYIDILIEEAKNNHGPGWKKRVASLEKMKKTAELLQKVDKGEDILATHQDWEEDRDEDCVIS